MTTTATTSGVTAGRQSIRAALPRLTPGPSTRPPKALSALGRRRQVSLAICLVAALVAWSTVLSGSAVPGAVALVGVVVVGPGLALVVERWIARRVVVPLFLGFVPPVRPARGLMVRCACCDTPLAPGRLRAIRWMAAAGRCRECRPPTPSRVATVESSTGALFLICGARFGVSWALWPALAFAAGAVAVSAVDLRTGRIPSSFVGTTAVLCGALIVWGSIVLGQSGVVVGALVGAGTAGALFSVLHIVSPAGLGMGDVRYAALVGLMAGWVGWSPGDAVAGPAGAALAAVFVATVVALAGHAIAGWRRRGITPLPFAPALTVSALAIVWSAP